MVVRNTNGRSPVRNVFESDTRHVIINFELTVNNHDPLFMNTSIHAIKANLLKRHSIISNFEFNCFCNFLGSQLHIPIVDSKNTL